MRLRFVAIAALLAASMWFGFAAMPAVAAGKTCFGHAATQTKPGPDGWYETTAGNDVIVGTSRADTVYSGAEGGTDYICLGSGNDYVSLVTEPSVPATYELTIDAGSGNDQVFLNMHAANKAALYGGSGNDLLMSNIPGATIDAGSGRDRVQDDGGATVIDCGSGVDRYLISFSPTLKRCEINSFI